MLLTDTLDERKVVFLWIKKTSVITFCNIGP